MCVAHYNALFSFSISFTSVLLSSKIRLIAQGELVEAEKRNFWNRARTDYLTFLESTALNEKGKHSIDIVVYNKQKTPLFCFF